MPGADAETAYLRGVAGSSQGSADLPDGSYPTILYLVGRVDRVVRRAIQDALKARGLSVNQYATLSVLDRRSGLSNAQLARRALVSPQSMNEVLLGLEERGLVRRRAHPDHGRILQTQLTAKGRKVLAGCDEQVQSVEAAMVAGMSAAEQQGFRDALLRCVRALHGGLEGD